MASIGPYKTKSGRRWEVQWTRPDGRRTRKRGFSTKAEAQAWIEDQGVAQRKGTWVDPALSNIPLSELWGPWIAIKKMRHGTSTWKPLDSAWRTHVKPRWGLTPISQITTEQLQTWIVDLSENRSVTIVERCLGVIRGLLELAVTNKRLSTNPATAVHCPARKRPKQVFLSLEQLEALASKCSDDKKALVWLLGTSGCRWGEAVGLTVGDVNPLRGRISVTKSASTVGGRVVVGATKGRRDRVIAATPAVFELLVPLMAGKSPDCLLWEKRGGGHLTTPSKRSWWHSAVDACVAEDSSFPSFLTPHDLRHTAASLLISNGASVKVVQAQLGHASAKETLDIYSGLFDEDLDSVIDAIGRAQRAAGSRRKNKGEPKMSQKAD